jgi:hypothetical protein
MPLSKWMTVRYLNDLKPTSSNFLILNCSILADYAPHYLRKAA